MAGPNFKAAPEVDEWDVVGDPWQDVLSAFPNHDERRLSAYFQKCEGNPERCIQAIRRSEQWKERLGEVSVLDIASSLQTQAFMLPLEGITSTSGHPVIYCKGMMQGDVTQMTRQVVYTMERTWAKMPPGVPIGFVWLWEVNKSFRPPDKKFRNAVLDTLEHHYPWVRSGALYVIDAPAVCRTLFSACQKYMSDSEAMQKIHFIARSEVPSLLKGEGVSAAAAKDGLQLFETEAYLAERSRAEGIDLSKLSTIQEDTDEETTQWDISFAEAQELAEFHGELWKRGHGGLTGTTRWKRKHMALFDGCMLYYDDEADLKPAQHVVLADSSVHAWESNKEHSFILRTPERDYHLACHSKEDRLQWMRRLSETTVLESGGSAR